MNRMNERSLTASPSIGARDVFGLYLHIPFCRTKCPYCDFNTYAGLERLIPGYLEALGRDLALWGQILGRPPTTSVFIGGGTPSLLNVAQMDALMRSISESFDLQSGAEITVEVNPDDVDKARLIGFRNSGINRISVGIQALDDPQLALLGRRHGLEGAVKALLTIRDAGFENVSADLMYGLPNQTVGMWEQTLCGLVELEPDHISAYCLTFEEGTPFEKMLMSGQIVEPDPDIAAEMYELSEQTLRGSGYYGYEISNWSRPGFESRHNLTYWYNLPYLGVGPGAHSHIAQHRFHSVLSPTEYILRVQSWNEPDPPNGGSPNQAFLERIPHVIEVEHISPSLALAETVIMTLRLREGIDRKGFQSRFNIDFNDVFCDVLPEMEELGLIEEFCSDDKMFTRLTSKGRLLGNQVFSRLLGHLA